MCDDEDDDDEEDEEDDDDAKAPLCPTSRSSSLAGSVFTFLGGNRTVSSAVSSSLVPTSFLATHTYVPPSSSFTAGNLNSGSTLKMEEWPSFLQRTLGGGFPLARQERVTEVPSSASSPGGLRSNRTAGGKRTESRTLSSMIRRGRAGCLTLHRTISPS